MNQQSESERVYEYENDDVRIGAGGVAVAGG